MVQVTYTPRWIEDSFFATANPQAAKIHAVAVEPKEGGGQEVVLELVSANNHVRMSLWGLNLKHFIEKFGSDTDKWTGRAVKVSQSIDAAGKRKRSVQCLSSN